MSTKIHCDECNTTEGEILERNSIRMKNRTTSVYFHFLPDHEDVMDLCKSCWTKLIKEACECLPKD